MTIDPALDQAVAELLPAGPVYVGLAPGAGGRPKCWPLKPPVTAVNGDQYDCVTNHPKRPEMSVASPTVPRHGKRNLAHRVRHPHQPHPL